jgi:hypothetical protein
MKRLMLATAFVLMISTFAQAEDPSPYKGINFQWEYGDYATHAGFNIYQVGPINAPGTTEPIVTVTDRTKRDCYHLMPLVIGQSMCFTMDAFDSKGNKSGMSKEACIIVPLPGVESFLAFPGVK